MKIFIMYILLFIMTYKIKGTITVADFFITLIAPIVLDLIISNIIRTSRISNLKKYIASVDRISMHSIWFSNSGKHAIAIDDDRKLITTFGKIDRDYQHEIITYSSVISAALFFNNQMIVKIRRETDITIQNGQESHDTTCTNTTTHKKPISFFKEGHDLKLLLKLINTKTSLYSILLYGSNEYRQVEDVIQETEQMVTMLHATIHPSCPYTKIILLEDSTSATKESTQAPTKSISVPQNPPPASTQLIKESTQTPTASVPVPKNSPPASTQLTVDINHADEVSLSALPGFGPLLAKKTIQFRESERFFYSVDDFVVTLNLKPHIVEQIKPHIMVKPSKMDSTTRPGRGRVIDF